MKELYIIDRIEGDYIVIESPSGEMMNVDKNEVKQLVEETIGSRANVRTLNESNSSILITVKDISDEQKNNLVAKINEKYSLELSQEDLKITNNAQIKLCDLIKPYIAPSINSIALIMN